MWDNISWFWFSLSWLVMLSISSCTCWLSVSGKSYESWNYIHRGWCIELHTCLMLTVLGVHRPKYLLLFSLPLTWYYSIIVGRHDFIGRAFLGKNAIWSDAFDGVEISHYEVDKYLNKLSVRQLVTLGKTKSCIRKEM